MRSILLLLFFIPNILFSQSGYEISGKINGLKNSEIYLAYYLNGNTYALDTTRTKKGQFTFSGKESLDGGMYLIVLPGKKWFDLIVSEQVFYLETSTSDLVGNMKFTNSKENEPFYEYLNFMISLRAKKSQLGDEEANRRALSYKNRFLSENPNIFFSKVIKAQSDPEIPNSINEDARFWYHKKRFWDNVDFSDSRILRTPIFHSKMENYMYKMTVKNPDSIIVSANFLIEKSRANYEIFKYVVSHIIAKYERMDYEWPESKKVFDYIASKYYKSGEVNWVNSNQLSKIVRKANLPSSFSEKQVRLFLDSKKNLDNIEGIYTYNSVNSNVSSQYQFLILKQDYKYEAYIMSASCVGCDEWRVGDVKSVFVESSVPGVYDVTWKYPKKRADKVIFYSKLNGSILTDNKSMNLIKLYPKNIYEEQPEQNINGWKGNGSGFIISTSGYIVTNYHVVEGMNEFEVEFMYGKKITSFNAKVVKSDATNDLAIIKIDDAKFKNLRNIPYSFKTRSSDVGTEVFALGYPMALTIMGKDIKFTDGKISSKTGFKGDVTTYQTTTPIQAGNSGGPLFDFNGNLIGINSSGLDKGLADNVSYSIKSRYLLDLIDVLPESIELPSSKELASKPLTEQIKILSDYVVLIKVK